MIFCTLVHDKVLLSVTATSSVMYLCQNQEMPPCLKHGVDSMATTFGKAVSPAPLLVWHHCIVLLTDTHLVSSLVLHNYNTVMNVTLRETKHTETQPICLMSLSATTLKTERNQLT